MADHHGIANSVLGNVFETHLFNRDGPLPGPNKQERLGFLNDDIRGYYSIEGVGNRLPPLKQENICSGGDNFPDLKGPLVKAANTRSCVKYCLDLQERAVRLNPTPQNKHMLKVVASLDAIYE
eukprot:3719540-Pyramimonas_sp.AAC.1